MYSLIIVDYCSISRTLNYIEHFLGKSKKAETITPIIIDNSPEPSNNIIIQKGYKQTGRVKTCNKEVLFFSKDETIVLYCFSGENLGYARGNNLGTNISDNLLNNEYYIISNNDIRLQDVFDGDIFVKIFEKKKDVGIIGPRIIGLDGKPQSPHKKVSAFTRLVAYYWFCRWPFRWKPDYDFGDESRICYRVMGSFMLIRAKQFKKIGGFDPNTFMFAEEMILSERLKQIDVKTYYYNDFTVVHEHGVTISNIGDCTRSEKWAFDSCCYYYEKYRGTSASFIKFAQINFVLYLKRLIIRKRIKEMIGERKGKR